MTKNGSGRNIFERYQKPLQYAAFLVAFAAVLATFIFPVNKDSLVTAGYAGVFIVTLLSAVSLLPGPSAIATFIAGGTLNPFAVSLVAGFGSALGESTGYLAGYGSHSFLASMDSAPDWLAKSRFYQWLYNKIIIGMTKYPFLTLFVVAAIPNFFVDVAGLVAGRAKYPYLRFFIAMFLGKSVRFALGAYSGAFFLK
jgi:membrane protein YqaA with SNARE-associated domain